MFNLILNDVDLFFLVAVRILALIETAPLFTGEGIPQVVKIGLAGFSASAVFPWIKEAGYVLPTNAPEYIGLVLGEALIGMIMGFFLTLVFSAFNTAGQFFSLQMGFGASETYDPLAQVEIPVVGQLLNLIAMFVFVSSKGFQKLFLIGVRGSFLSLNTILLVEKREAFYPYVIGALGSMFQNALILAFPIFGTLLLVSVTTGLLSKAAPQINLLTEGFPISILVAFFILTVAMPYLIESFTAIIDGGFELLGNILESIKT